MARNLGTVLLNNFSRGLITEATGLNFPDNAVTQSDNVIFERIGKVSRRLGYDIESEASAIGYGDDSTEGILVEYLWEAVAKHGGFTFLVVQYGSIIRFYEMNTASSVSVGLVPYGFDLRSIQITGSPPVNQTPASFAAGAGYLFITHPSCEPVIISYDSDDDIFSMSPLEIRIRDFEGLEDDLDEGEEPKDLSVEHAYNLKNQGWYKPVRVGSANNEPSGGSLTDIFMDLFDQQTPFVR